MAQRYFCSINPSILNQVLQGKPFLDLSFSLLSDTGFFTEHFSLSMCPAICRTRSWSTRAATKIAHLDFGLPYQARPTAITNQRLDKPFAIDHTCARNVSDTVSQWRISTVRNHTPAGLGCQRGSVFYRPIQGKKAMIRIIRGIVGRPYQPPLWHCYSTETT